MKKDTINKLKRSITSVSTVKGPPTSVLRHVLTTLVSEMGCIDDG